MRTLKLQMQMTINGFVGGPNGEIDWLALPWDSELEEFVDEITDPVDRILLGKNMADGFISHWKAVAEDPDNEEYESGKKFTETPKTVFSTTLKESPWDNTTIASGDLTEEINTLKSQDGGDIIVYGGASFVSNLIKEDLIDDYYLFINPTSLKEGLSIFGERKDLKLHDVRKFDCGIVLLHYKK